MKRYIIRSIKYFVALVVLYAGIVGIMQLTQANILTYAERWQLLFTTDRGWMMVAATILLAATYPAFGFVKRTFEGDIVRHREQITTALLLKGFRLYAEECCELHFRASGLRRVTMLFEDEIVVRQAGVGVIEIEGLRRAAVPVALDVARYIENFERNNE